MLRQSHSEGETIVDSRGHTYRVDVGEVIEGEVYPAEMGRVTQQVGHHLLEATEVGQGVIVQPECLAVQLFTFSAFYGPQALSGFFL